MNMIFKKFPAAALIDGEWITSAKSFSVTDRRRVRKWQACRTSVPRGGVGNRRGEPRIAGWSAKTAKERAAILRRWFDLITAETESLAK
jgi:succinate-semialdehyde dehydrogenase/glutarate-semialdehyde dehydrogenase